ncbi:MAG: serine hydrolase domain-containing protein, partial [Candidatus Heimdallarchaeota archaeon]
MKSKANFEKIEGMITTLMQQLKIPGLSISVIADNETIYSKGFGARDLKNNLSATPDTLFGIGSVTKSFTTLAIMQLVEQGKLSLDDPISKYVPFKLGKKDKPILIRHFMSHSSGIPDLETALIIIARHSWPKLETYIPMGNFEDFMIHVNNATSEVVHDPGTRYYYLNTGYAILGRIIEQLSGMKYNDYIKKNILEPLEMQRATFKQENFEKENDKMVGYIAGEGGALVKTSHPFDEMLYAAGGILTSVRELENYVKMNLNNGTFKGKTLLKPENHKKLSQSQVSTPDTYFKELTYCFGWSRNDDFYGEVLIEHGGSTAVSSAHIAYIP